ncbi:Ig-like domain-containing protein [Staphylococcus equorum]|uniref:Ig-like domain-containing protein n=1 Tax=Staphylococcus equorum TaxID=246432 RepID=UPI003D800720
MNSKITGNDVTNQVDFTNTTISVKNNKIRPIDAESFKLTISFKTKTAIKSGDYFKFKGSYNTISDDLNHGNTSAPTIKDKDGNIIALGVYNPKTKEYTYTFTDFADNKKNISCNIKLSQYIDRDTVRNSSNERITYTFGDKIVSQNISVIYDSGYEEQASSNIGSAFTHYNSETKKYEQTIYINPKKKTAYNSKVLIKGYKDKLGDSSAQINRNTQIKIYKVRNGVTLNDSYYNDEANLIDVTNQLNSQNILMQLELILVIYLDILM